MQIGTKVTYTQKGYASDFLVKINNQYVNVPQRKAIKEEEYTQRKGIVTNIEKAKCGSVTYTVKWEDVGGYWEDDTSYVYREDIQEIEEEVVEEEVVEAQETQKCVLCLYTFEGYGHNAEPLSVGRCCSGCNEYLVIPKRIKDFFRNKQS